MSSCSAAAAAAPSFAESSSLSVDKSKEASSFASTVVHNNSNKKEKNKKKKEKNMTNHKAAREPTPREVLANVFADNIHRVFPLLLKRDSKYHDSICQAIQASTLYRCMDIPAIPRLLSRKKEGGSSMEVRVVNMDSLECARLFQHDNPLVHNMASNAKPGGGVISGAKAQEESLCRRSLLYMFLDKFYRSTYGGKQMSASGKTKKKVEDWYSGGRGSMSALEEECSGGGISYNPDVLVIRDTQNEMLPESDWFSVSFVTCAAIKHPRVNEAGTHMTDEEDVQIMVDKYKALLRLAYAHKHRTIILSAFGSGVYKVPCQHMAEILFELLFQDREFAGAFDRIYIAIIDPYLNTENYRVYDAALTAANTIASASVSVSAPAANV